MLIGINHITIAVSDLERSLVFYVDSLGCRAEARWDKGAYLVAGTTWICLSVDHASPAQDYTHLAFSVPAEDFSPAVEKLTASGVSCWKSNVSEGNSFYFLDPDGHKLELHCGDLDSRLASVDKDPYPGWTRISEKAL